MCNVNQCLMCECPHGDMNSADVVCNSSTTKIVIADVKARQGRQLDSHGEIKKGYKKRNVMVKHSVFYIAF